jgi:hypothetical protein
VLQNRTFVAIRDSFLAIRGFQANRQATGWENLENFFVASAITARPFQLRAQPKWLGYLWGRRIVAAVGVFS